MVVLHTFLCAGGKLSYNFLNKQISSPLSQISPDSKLFIQYKDYGVQYCAPRIRFKSLTFPCQQCPLVPMSHRQPFSGLKPPAVFSNNSEYLSLMQVGENGDETDLRMQPCLICPHSQYCKSRPSDILR